MTPKKPDTAAEPRSATEKKAGGATPSHTKRAKPVILMVDDEMAILSAFGRALRQSGYELLTASSGIAALELLTRQTVDVVISDMNMPRMDGAELLGRVKKNWPNTTRVLITGHSDISAAIRAINRGGIHFYISKPWDDDDLRVVLEEAVDRARVYRENEHLMALTRSQNVRLEELNAELESRVEARTEELQKATTRLETRNRSLNDSYRATIRMLAGLIEMRPGIEKGFARDVADLAMRIARMGDLSRRDCMNIYYAALLHELGKVGLPEEVLTETTDMSNEQKELHRQYPVLGQFAMEGTEFLRGAGGIVVAHCENWDGQGFPNRLKAHDIPMGARVLRVARDYVRELKALSRVAPKLRARHAFQTLQPETGSRYDADVMHWLEKVLDKDRRESAMEDEASVVVRQLVPGMTLSRDVITSHGVVMLAKEHLLTERNIDHLADLQVMERREITVWVYT